MASSNELVIVDHDDDVSESQIVVGDMSPIRSDLLLRHDIVNILINAQRTESRARARILERKTALVRYCSVLLRWIERTMERRQHQQQTTQKGQPQIAAASGDGAALVIQSASPSPTSSPARGGTAGDNNNEAPRTTTAAAAATAATTTNPTSRSDDTFATTSHATLHALRRKWQRRAAVLLERRSLFIVRQRFFNMFKLFMHIRRCNRGAMRAVSSVETAATLNRKRRRQVVLNSVDMQRMRALRAVSVRAFFKWRMFIAMRSAAALTKKNQQLEEANVAAATSSSDRLKTMKGRTEAAEGDDRKATTTNKKAEVAPASLSQLVDSLRPASSSTAAADGTSNNNNNNNNNVPHREQTPPSPPPSRPTFFHAPPPNSGGGDEFSSPLGPNGATPTLMGESGKAIKGKLKSLRRDMTKMKDDVRQANKWIAAECTQWDLHFQRKVRGGPNPLPTTAGDKKQPPSWEYERALLTRRAAAYDALLDDHRMLQESLQAAEEDIARLRSLAVLRELHSPESSLAGGVIVASAAAAAGGAGASPSARSNKLGLSSGRMAVDAVGVNHSRPRRGGNNASGGDSSAVMSPGGAQMPPEEIGMSCFSL